MQLSLKHYLLASLLAVATLTAGASTQWTLQNKSYNVDTLYHAQIGPGTTHTALKLSGAQNLRVFYATIDLSSPYVDLRVAQAGKTITGGAKLSSMCSANSTNGARYFAGVNADFFGNSQPIGSTVVNGDVYKAVNEGWTNWYFTTDRRPAIANLNFTGYATCGENSQRITSINGTRGEGALVVYTPRKGSATGTNEWGSEIRLSPVNDSKLTFVGNSEWVAVTDFVNAGNSTIPSNGDIILSGHGVGANFVRSLKKGDHVTIEMTTALPVEGQVAQMAGGQPRILSQGKTLDTQGALDHLTALNPRTAIGHSADGQRVVILVVDGRQSGVSVGVVSKVLADIMREVGCDEAMNFDGGGSSEFYSSALGVCNHPSDGSERTVVNSVWAVCTAPDDTEIASIAFMNNTITLPKYGYYKPVIYGYNKYGMLVSTAVEGYTLSCDDQLGTVTDDGSTLFVSGSGYHALKATLGSATASIPVTVGSAQPEIRLNQVVVDSYRSYKAEVQAIVEGSPMQIDNKALTWSSSDETIATVTDEGIISGIAVGNATITGAVGQFTGTLPVSVEIPSKHRLPIDSPVDPSTWSVSKTSLSAASVSACSPDGLAVDYTVSSTRGTCVTLKKIMPLYALPDSLRIVFNPGDNKINTLSLSMAGKGTRPTPYSITGPFAANTNNVILVPMSDIIDVNDFVSYPVEFTSIAIYIADPVKTVGHLEFPAIETVYCAVDDSTNSAVDTLADNTDSALKIAAQGTTLLLDTSASATWCVFAADGRCLLHGNGATIDASTLPAGIYIITASEGATLKSARIAIR